MANKKRSSWAQIMFEGFYGSRITFTPLCPFIFFFLFFQHMLCYQIPSFLEVRQGILAGFSFHYKPLIEHLISFSFLRSLYLLISRYQYQCLFFIPFTSSLMIFLFFVHRSNKRSFCLVFRYSCVFSTGEAFAFFIKAFFSF